jgi:uncharacterized membrane protein YqjE
VQALQQRTPGIVAGPLVWAAHFTLCYALLSVGCSAGWQNASVLGLDLIRGLLLLATAAAVAMLSALLIRSVRQRNREPAGTRPRFMAAAAAGLNVLSLIAVLWTGLAIPLTVPC